MRLKPHRFDKSFANADLERRGVVTVTVAVTVAVRQPEPHLVQACDRQR